MQERAEKAAQHEDGQREKADRYVDRDEDAYVGGRPEGRAKRALSAATAAVQAPEPFLYIVQRAEVHYHLRRPR
jgi:hypothetical protein